MGQTAVSRRLSGEIPLDFDDLDRFAEALNVPLSRFIGSGDDMGEHVICSAPSVIFDAVAA